jgi:peptidoglycan/LPS O-acetylase OafA/YrhL
LKPVTFSNGQEKKIKPYFEGLNGLRFVAALLVVLYHAPDFPVKKNISTIYNFRSFSLFNNGALAVDFFFVFSGFLITSLLLKEYEYRRTISIKRFYMRRILRIWPLYYFAVFFCFAVLPLAAGIFHFHNLPDTGVTQLLLYLLFLPNLVFITGGPGVLSPLWSIGVEVLFYLFIGPLVKYFKNKLVLIFLLVIVIKVVLNVIFARLQPVGNWHSAAVFFSELRFEVISVGCIGALLVNSKYKYYLKRLFSYPVQIVMFALMFAVVFFNQTLPVARVNAVSSLYNFLFSSEYSSVIKAILFLYLIFCVSLNSKSLIKTENKVLSFLGNISYGIYVYHVLVELLILDLLKAYFLRTNTIAATIIYYFSSIAATILVAYLSYTFFEKKFLTLKRKFE